ncbi:MAG: DUF4365 domain-containing protein [Gammaproteobacteria bacterium]|nr:DUF4365 domain-containing protein [Gammaproteobacteria bacterium]
MIVVGKTDSFERKYMERFRLLASEFGEFVNYEHDRGARDIGIHLTHKLSSGTERLSTALCWFQMKGIMSSTLSEIDYENIGEVSIQLKVEHLQYWYLQPMPTYLAIYIECAGIFLVTNVQEYVTEKWDRKILKLDQKTASVSVSKESQLDAQAFRLILGKSDLEEWKKALGAEEDEVRLCRRDYDLIWHFGTAQVRNVKHRLVFWDWQSKTRGQLYIQERETDSEEEWETLREHWQYLMDVSQLEDAYPYLEFFADQEREDQLSWDYDEDEYGAPSVILPNGDAVSGEDAAGEYFYYEMGVKLNEIGNQMFEWVKDLEQVGLIEITPGKSEMISVAPWHGRDV